MDERTASGSHRRAQLLSGQLSDSDLPNGTDSFPSVLSIVNLRCIGSGVGLEGGRRAQANPENRFDSLNIEQLG